MKILTAGILLTILLGACVGNNTTKKSRNFELDCSNNYKVAFSENITIRNGDSTGKITLRVRSPKFNGEYSLKQVRAASGVKYASKDEKYIFWEHQGEFIFGTEDSTYCLCD